MSASLPRIAADRRISPVGVFGASYAALAAGLGLVAVLTDATGLTWVGASFMLATLLVYFGRMVVVDIGHILVARRALSLGDDVRSALESLDGGFRVTRMSNDDLGREDHVVVGPTGVFVIVAAEGDRRAGASHRRLFTDSRAWWRDMIEDCHIEALRVGERLRRAEVRPTTVHPVLCLRSGLVTVGRVVRGVRVVHMQELARTITEMPPAPELDARQIGLATASLETVAQVIPLRPRARVDRVPPAGAVPRLTSV